MSTESTSPFTPEVVKAVVDHMNTDHPEDNLLIVRSLGGVPAATDARMTRVGPEGAEFQAELADGSTAAAVVPWAAPVLERAHIRAEVVRMYHEACDALGVAPRTAGEH